MSNISNHIPPINRTDSLKENDSYQKSPNSITSTAVKHFPKGLDALSHYSSFKTRERYIKTVLPMATPPSSPLLNSK